MRNDNILLPENIHPLPRHPGTTHEALVNEELNDMVQPDGRGEGKIGQADEVLQVIYLKWYQVE